MKSKIKKLVSLLLENILSLLFRLMLRNICIAFKKKNFDPFHLRC